MILDMMKMKTKTMIVMMNVDAITIINVGVTQTKDADVKQKGELFNKIVHLFIYRDFIANSILLRPSKTIDLGQAKFIL